MRSGLKLRKIIVFFIAVMLAVSLSACSSSKPKVEDQPPQNETPSDLAYNWIKGQKGSGGLYASFQNGSVSYTYDQAVAAIAFLLKNDAASAKALLTKLQSLQAADGSFYNAYFTETSQPQESAKHTGANLWVAMAVMNYERLTGDLTTYHQMAEKVAKWSMQFQQADGGVNGGLNFDGSLLSYASTEHNLDAYSVYKYLGFTSQASQVKSFLDNVAWDSGSNHFRVGRPNGDNNDVLDVNPWGVMALGNSGTHPYSDSLAYSMNVHRNKQTLNEKTYDLFDFNHDKNDIWFEGSNFMAIALKLVGDSKNSDYFLNEIIKNQDVDGGVQYSLLGTNNFYWTMSADKAISSTGWLIMAIAGHNPFQTN